MKNVTTVEMRTVNGGAVTYWYTTDRNCTYYAKSKNYFAEPVAYAKVAMHKRFCSLCCDNAITYSYSLPWYK